jgi:hypothetical protein
MSRTHFDISHQKITDYLLQFCVSRIHGMDNAASETPRTFGTHTGFVSLELAGDQAVLELGDLLLISGHRRHEFRMGWLKQVRTTCHGAEYLVQSTCGEGQIDWLYNVDVAFFHRPTLAQHPEWRWTNEQHWLAEQWMEAVTQFRDTRLIAPVIPCFLGDSVRLKARGRFGISEIQPERLITDFRELTQDTLLSTYDELCQEIHTGKIVRAEVAH